MKPSQIKNYHERLGVSQNAGPREIRDAYRRMVNRWHYDRNPSNMSDFIAVCEAYRILSNESIEQKLKEIRTEIISFLIKMPIGEKNDRK